MTTLARPAYRLLSDRAADRLALDELLHAAPVENCVLISRISGAGSLRPELLGGQLWGIGDQAGLRAGCFVGGTVIPIGPDVDALRSLLPSLAARVRPCSSIVGPAALVAALWAGLEHRWGPARLLRLNQPLLVSVGPALFPVHPEVRRAVPADLPVLFPAAVAMFTEELDVSPLARDGGRVFRARLEDLVAAGRVYVLLDDNGEVVFKAELAAETPAMSQVQGVWVRPDLRGHGLGTTAMAAVLAAASVGSQRVSLYVNDFNEVARRMYARLGMAQVGTFATILF